MNHVVNDISIKDLYVLLSKKKLSAEVFQIYNKLIGHRRITDVSVNNNVIRIYGKDGYGWILDFNKSKLLSDYNFFLSEEDSIANELNQDYKKLEEVGGDI